MCGIIGYVGNLECAEILVDGLSKLEYRGYDSAGIAVLDDGVMSVRRAEGKLAHLREVVKAFPVSGRTGIGHTRWATHGGPTENNAHPHRSGTVAVVHNGIIENYLSLKRQLQAQGRTFLSETDTEVIAHLIAREREQGLNLPDAVVAATRLLEGAYSIVVIDEQTPDTLVVARLSSPLVLGLGDGQNFVASDLPAILSHTRSVVFLGESVIAVVRPDGVEAFDAASGEAVVLSPRQIDWSPAMAEKSGYKHFMLKEIHEQPQAVTDTLRGRFSDAGDVELPEVPIGAIELKNLSRFYIVACGTSWHAGLVGRYLFEDLAGLSPYVEQASEMRYRNAPMDDRTLVLAISQSGETADTLAAIRDAKAKGAKVLSVCNVIESSIPRESIGTLYTHAGPEIGVASTKAFTTQLVALHLLALKFGQLLGRVSEEAALLEMESLQRVPALMEEQLRMEKRWNELAQFLGRAHSVLFLGRGALYPVALEGALKLKEISYIHAEGYAAGEMKHGPIALIEESVPTIVLHPRDAHFDKVRSNLQEVKARGGPVVAVVSLGDEEAKEVLGANDWTVATPQVPLARILPLVMSIPMQLIAYHVADHRGADIDQPRNLAKSVTVE